MCCIRRLQVGEVREPTCAGRYDSQAAMQIEDLDNKSLQMICRVQSIYLLHRECGVLEFNYESPARECSEQYLKELCRVCGCTELWLFPLRKCDSSCRYIPTHIAGPSNPVNMESMDIDVFAGIKAVFFDFMGTCLDWHSNIVKALPDRIPHASRVELSLAWRQAFFEDIHYRFDKGLPAEDIDNTHARLLVRLLADDSRFSAIELTEHEQAALVQAWHYMSAWPDVPEALQRLKSRYEVCVLANGTTRLQLDLARSSGLDFDLLLSSQLLGFAKPEPKIYVKALDLLRVKPEQVVMVAAHAYDLRAAKAVGMRTVYIRRTTEELQESMDRVRVEVDSFVDGRDAMGLGGLGQVARLLGV